MAEAPDTCPKHGGAVCKPGSGWLCECAYRPVASFLCPGCGEEEFIDTVGVVTCECGAHIETLEPLGLRRILPNFWTRLRGSAAPASPPQQTSDGCRTCHRPWTECEC